MKRWVKKVALCGLAVVMVLTNTLVIHAEEEEAEYIPEGMEFCTCEDPDNYRINNKDATCTEYGYQIASMCDACGKFMSYTHFDAPRGHDYSFYAIERATKEKAGVAAEMCSRCNDWRYETKMAIPKVGELTVTDKTYNGQDQKTDFLVTDVTGAKIEPLWYSFEGDYMLGTIFGNDVGIYDVTITFDECSYWEGSLSASWRINPQGTKIKSVSSGKKRLTVKWKKQKKQTTGYEIQVATNKKFTKNLKTVTIKKNKASVVIKKLKAKKNYYVRIRTYKNTDKGACYSDWSKAVKKKTK